MALEMKSSAFRPNETIPVKHTCSGEDVSPPLSWQDVPQGTVSLALICDDPDAPGGSWVHWVIYNIPADSTDMPEGVAQEERIGEWIYQGVNDFNRIGYNGPCPPRGRPHRYIFTIYALDTTLDFRGKVNKESLLRAMKGHVLGQGSLIGKFGR